MKGSHLQALPVRTGDGQRRSAGQLREAPRSWFYIHDVPPDVAGKRRQVRKGGFAN